MLELALACLFSVGDPVVVKATRDTGVIRHVYTRCQYAVEIKPFGEIIFNQGELDIRSPQPPSDSVKPAKP